MRPIPRGSLTCSATTLRPQQHFGITPGITRCSSGVRSRMLVLSADSILGSSVAGLSARERRGSPSLRQCSSRTRDRRKMAAKRKPGGYGSRSFTYSTYRRRLVNRYLNCQPGRLANVARICWADCFGSQNRAESRFGSLRSAS